MRYQLVHDGSDHLQRDTLGIRPDLIKRPINSWTELLNPEFKGKASILNISSIGIMDAAMVCEAMGEVQYGDKGNMTKDEIDKTMAIFTEAKKAGQFRAFWKSFDESVNLMASGEVVIQSMWSPAITKVRSMGIPCVYQPLKEGYRSWGGGLRCHQTSPDSNWMQPTNTSTGTCPVGLAACLCVRATTPLHLRRPKSTCQPMSGASGSKVKLRSPTSSTHLARRWSLPVQSVMAARSTTAWAPLSAGTP